MKIIAEPIRHVVLQYLARKTVQVSGVGSSFVLDYAIHRSFQQTFFGEERLRAKEFDALYLIGIENWFNRCHLKTHFHP